MEYSSWDDYKKDSLNVPYPRKCERKGKPSKYQIEAVNSVENAGSPGGCFLKVNLTYDCGTRNTFIFHEDEWANIQKCGYFFFPTGE